MSDTPKVISKHRKHGLVNHFIVIIVKPTFEHLYYARHRARCAVDIRSLVLSQLHGERFALPLSQCRKPGLGAVKDFPKSQLSELMNPMPVPLSADLRKLRMVACVKRRVAACLCSQSAGLGVNPDLPLRAVALKANN